MSFYVIPWRQYPHIINIIDIATIIYFLHMVNFIFNPTSNLFVVIRNQRQASTHAEKITKIELPFK